MLNLIGLKCEHMENPVGISSNHPVFSWILDSKSGVDQQSYRVRVVDELGQFVWDSGTRQTDCSIDCRYDGQELKPLSTYMWTVTVTDTSGETASAEGKFVTSRRDLPWEASWIEPEQEPTPEEQKDASDASVMDIQSEVRGLDDYSGFQPIKYLRIPFKIEKEVKQIYLTATAHGVYEISVNGTRPDDRYLAPEISAYSKILLYQIYDVTNLVHRGQNVISVKLADGWWSGRVGYMGTACQFGNKTAFLLEGRIRYKDGTSGIIRSDDAVSSTGPLLVSDLFVGEKYDARLELGNWEDPDYDDTSWKAVNKVKYSMKPLTAQPGAPIRVVKQFEPKRIFIDPDGSTVIDLGQNIAGFMSFTVKAKAGTVIRMEHAEVLDKNGKFFKNIMGTNKDQLDVYITKEGIQSWHPAFTYHGFRYVRLTGWPGTPEAKNFTANVLSTDLKQTGHFETSNALINQLEKNIFWSQLANNIGIPTDCPQREKAGWTGDVSVYSPTMCFLRDEQEFLRRWLDNCRAEQEPNGEIPTVVPLLKCYSEMNRYFGSDTSCGWGDVIVWLPWNMYQAYGCKDILEENYDAMRKWLRYVQNCAENEMPEDFDKLDDKQRLRQKYLWNTGFHYGDWLVPSLLKDRTDGMAMIDTAYQTKELTASACYAHSTDLMSRIASVLGKVDDAKYYASLNAKIRKAFEEEYIDEKGHIRTDLQGIYVLALQYGLVSGNKKKGAIERLLEKINENGGCLDTGFLSVPVILDVLMDSGNRDAAYRLLYQDKCPSWLYEVKNGATTLWESWDAINENGDIGKYSFNHYAYGSIGSWMYRRLAGIQAEEAGYRKIRIDPAYDCGLDRIECRHITPYGETAVRWANTSREISLEVVIPNNTEAIIVLPDGKQLRKGPGNWKFTCPQ